MSSLLLLKSMLFANALQSETKKKKKKIVIRKSCNFTSNKLNLSLCRICYDEKGHIPIFNVENNLSEEIKNFSGITLSKSDNFSKHMCQSCLDLLNGCILFRDMCQKSEKKMLELSIKKEYTKLDDEVIKDSDESYNVPSPAFSDDNSLNSEIWGCSTCRKEFCNLASYNKHLSKCSLPAVSKQPTEMAPKKSFLCDICGKTARSNASLLIHKGVHEKVFPFKCDVCPYQGRTKDLLTVHQRSHLIDKPFKCTQCPKATTTASNLAKHMRHVHSTTRPFKCNYCEKAFSYQHDMKRHIKDIHLRQGTVECDMCFKKFNTKKILQGHRWKIHKIKSERQGRLPSYLQYQIDVPHDNINNCEFAY